MQIGQLTIEMAANITRLQTDMSQAKSTVEGAMRGIEASVEVAKRAFVGLTGIAGLVGFKMMIDNVIEAKAKLKEMSEQTGASVESLSAIGAVSKLTGTDITDVAGAMNKLQKSLATSKEDGRGAAVALKSLGLEFKTFKDMSPDQQMLAVAKAMAGFADGGGKSAAAMLLYGKTGAQLLPMLKDLAETHDLVGKTTTASAEMADHYEKSLVRLSATGQAWRRKMVDELLPTMVDIVDELVAMRNSTGEAGTALGQGLNNVLQTTVVLGANTAYVIKQIGIEIGGMTAQVAALTRLDFSSPLKGLESFVKLASPAAMAAAAIRGDWSAFSLIGDLMRSDAEKARKEVDRLSNSIINAGSAVTDVSDALSRRLDRAGRPKLKVDVPEQDQTDPGRSLLNTLMKEYDHLTHTIDKYGETLRALDAINKPVDSSLRKRILDTAELIDAEKRRQEGIKQLIAVDIAQTAYEMQQRGIVAGFIDAQNDATAAVLRRTQTLGMTSDELTKYNALQGVDLALLKALQGANADTRAELEKMAEVLKGNLAEAMDAQIRRQRELTDSPMEGVNRAMKEYEERVRRAGDAWHDLAGNAIGGLEDTLTQFFSKGKADWKSYFATIAQEALRLRVIRPLMNELFGAAGGGGGGLAGYLGGTLRGAVGAAMGGGGIGGMYGPDNIDVGGWSPAGFRAGGGPVSAGMPYVVGEKRAEVFIPDSAGSIQPSVGGNSFAPVYNIHVDSRTDRAEVYSVIGRAMQESNQRFAEQLRQQGVIG